MRDVLLLCPTDNNILCNKISDYAHIKFEVAYVLTFTWRGLLPLIWPLGRSINK